jgi:hypothetical protein
MIYYSLPTMTKERGTKAETTPPTSRSDSLVGSIPSRTCHQPKNHPRVTTTRGWGFSHLQHHQRVFMTRWCVSSPTATNGQAEQGPGQQLETQKRLEPQVGFLIIHILYTKFLIPFTVYLFTVARQRNRQESGDKGRVKKERAGTKAGLEMRTTCISSPWYSFYYRRVVRVDVGDSD